MCSTMGLTIASQFSFSGVYLCEGQRMVRVSEATSGPFAEIAGNAGFRTGLPAAMSAAALESADAIPLSLEE